MWFLPLKIFGQISEKDILQQNLLLIWSVLSGHPAEGIELPGFAGEEPVLGHSEGAGQADVVSRFWFSGMSKGDPGRRPRIQSCPARYGSSEEYSKFRPHRGLRFMSLGSSSHSEGSIMLFPEMKYEENHRNTDRRHITGQMGDPDSGQSQKCVEDVQAGNQQRALAQNGNDRGGQRAAHRLEIVAAQVIDGDHAYVYFV